jgi:methylmalonyl-CoA mutase
MVKMNKLFGEFNPIDTQVWEEVILRDLKGADYSKKLITKTIDGIDIKPYYRKEDVEQLPYQDVLPGEYPYIRTNYTDTNDFKIRRTIAVNDFKTAGLQGISAVEKGATAIGFELSPCKVINYEDFCALIKGINPEITELHFTGLHFPDELLSHIIRFVQEHHYSFDKITGSVDFDPLSSKTFRGTHHKEPETKCKFPERIKILYDLTKDTLPKYKIVGVNASNFKNAGSSSVQELAFALAIGNEYLAKADDEGVTAELLAHRMIFTFGISSNYFTEIAKIRAARLLWTKIVEAYGLKDKANAYMHVHSVTCDWNKTAYDAYVNVLRTTTEAASGILGGSDSITVNPFNSSFNIADEFSERIAQNIPIILKEEAYFDKAIDPAAGSYYIESLTDSVAQQAWTLFLEIENAGGYHEAFKKGMIKSMIEETAHQRNVAIAQRKEILLGTNQYPDQNEKITITKKVKASVQDDAIKLYRGAEAFEELRQKTEKAKNLPKVFLLTMGNMTMRKARANFTANFFACAGFEIIDNPGFKTIEEGVKACLDSKAEITVICSSDDEYADIVPCIFEKLKDKTMVVVAGYPQNCIEALKKFGVNNYIHVKSNVLESLKVFQRELGII